MNAVLLQRRLPALKIIESPCGYADNIVQWREVEHAAATVLAELPSKWLARIRHVIHVGRQVLLSFRDCETLGCPGQLRIAMHVVKIGCTAYALIMYDAGTYILGTDGCSVQRGAGCPSAVKTIAHLPHVRLLYWIDLILV